MIDNMGAPIEDFDETILLGLPEATILTLVEQHMAGVEAGVREDVLIPGMLGARAALLAPLGTQLPSISAPYSLERCIEHCLHYEHAHGIQIDPRFVSLAVREVRAFYGR